MQVCSSEYRFALALAPATVSLKSQARLSCYVEHERRNWLFCWTEVGAQHAGIVQSLITTCRLHGIDPYTYLVDVLQRVGTHPAARVVELTPRLWKQHFAASPLRSALHGVTV